MRTSDNISNLATALAAMQGEMKPAKMNSINPFLKNRYADLSSIHDAVRALLTKHGLSYVQMPSMADSERIGIALTTRLMHNSGEWLEDTFFMPMPADEKGKSLMQVAGSAVTYARRYALAAMLGIVADEDTDGNAPPPGTPKKTESATAAKSGDWPTLFWAEASKRKLNKDAALEIVNQAGGDFETAYQYLTKEKAK